MNQMKTILYIFSLLSSIASVFGQEEKKPSHFMANLNAQMVYRGISNYYEYAVCENCDTIFITTIGAEILNQSTYSFEVVPLPGRRDISVATNCVQGMDTIRTAWRYNVRSLPNPTIYLGGINLKKSNLDLLDEASFFGQTRLTARYDETVELINVYFSIKEWSISVGEKTFIGSSPLLSNEYKEAFLAARRRTPIKFNYVIVGFPGGRDKKINLDVIYFKKSKRNEKIEVKDQNRYITPEKCG